jgi:hypothetical protein
MSALLGETLTSHRFAVEGGEGLEVGKCFEVRSFTEYNSVGGGVAEGSGKYFLTA